MYNCLVMVVSKLKVFIQLSAGGGGSGGGVKALSVCVHQSVVVWKSSGCVHLPYLYTPVSTMPVSTMPISTTRLLLLLSRQKLLFVWFDFYRLVRCRLVQMPVITKQLLVLWRYPNAGNYESEPKYDDIVTHLASKCPAYPSHVTILDIVVLQLNDKL